MNTTSTIINVYMILDPKVIQKEYRNRKTRQTRHEPLSTIHLL